MRKWIAILAVVFGLVSLAACGNNTIAESKAGKVTKEDFYKELKAKAGDQILQDMVFHDLLAKKYKVSDKEIDKKIDDLKKQNNITSDEQLKSVIESNGSTMKDFRDSVEYQLLFFKAATDGVKVTDKEMKDYFDKNKDNLVTVKASHILVKDKKTAEEVENKLKNGEDFAKLAETYSTDEGTKKKGGELGWIKKGQMVKPFEEAVFSLPVDKISDPVKSEYGYHVIKVEDKKDSLDDFKDQIKEAILGQKAKPQQEVINSLIKNGDIKVDDKQFKDLFKEQPVQQPQLPTTPSGSGKGDTGNTDSGKSDSSDK